MGPPVLEEAVTWFRSGRDWPRQENTGTWILSVFGLVHFRLQSQNTRIVLGQQQQDRKENDTNVQLI